MSMHHRKFSTNGSLARSFRFSRIKRTISKRKKSTRRCRLNRSVKDRGRFPPDRFERSSRSEHELLQGADIVPDDQPEHQSHTDGGDNANETEDAPQENGGETRSNSFVRTFVFVFSDIFGEEQFEEET